MVMWLEVRPRGGLKMCHKMGCLSWDTLWIEGIEEIDFRIILILKLCCMNSGRNIFNELHKMFSMGSCERYHHGVDCLTFLMVGCD